MSKTQIIYIKNNTIKKIFVVLSNNKKMVKVYNGHEKESFEMNKYKLKI